MTAYIEQQTICEQDSEGAKYWRCGVCNKYMQKKCDLVRHMESFHLVTDPYNCQYCVNVQFKTMRALQRHTNSTHK